jgi:hypothetical protein
MHNVLVLNGGIVGRLFRVRKKSFNRRLFT